MKNKFILGYGSRRMRVHCGGEAGWQGAWSRKLRAHIFKQAQKSERNRLEVGLGYELSKHTPVMRFL